MRARGRCRHGWKSTECCEPAICVVSKRDISLHNIQRNIWKIQDGGCWHVRFVAFVTILLNRPHRSRRFIHFKALFSCKKHQGNINKTQWVMVANLATNFWILVASTIILVALPVLGAISCRGYAYTFPRVYPRCSVSLHAACCDENASGHHHYNKMQLSDRKLYLSDRPKNFSIHQIEQIGRIERSRFVVVV